MPTFQTDKVKVVDNRSSYGHRYFQCFSKRPLATAYKMGVNSIHFVQMDIPAQTDSNTLPERGSVLLVVLLVVYYFSYGMGFKAS